MRPRLNGLFAIQGVQLGICPGCSSSSKQSAALRSNGYDKTHHPAPCHPEERTRISYVAALPAATYAALRKESRKKSTEATVIHRKSGAAEGPAVRLGSLTNVSVPSVLPQNRHPERSASPSDRVTLRLERGVEGPRRFFSPPCCSELFNHQASFGGHGLSPVQRTKNILQPSSANRSRSFWLRWSKSSEQHG